MASLSRPPIRVRFKKDHITFGNIVQDDLLLNLDAGNPLSYPGSGTIWTDLSGNGYNATLVNGVGYSADNLGSLTFDGVDDYATIPDDDIWNIGSAKTWEMWINMNSVANDKVAFGKGSQWWFSVSYTSLGGTSGEFNWIAYDGSWNTLNTGIVISTNTWYHLMVTWDGSFFRFYANGELASTSSNYSAKVWNNSTFPVDIGGFSAGSGKVNAKIPIVRIYDGKELLDFEVFQNFNALRTRYGI